jgi:hypothetical protein
MKLSDLIARYHALAFSLAASNDENESMGREADGILKRICGTCPQDADDVAALARLARHIIQEEHDPVGAVPLLHNIASWATREELGLNSTNIVPFVRHTHFGHKN